MNKYLTIPTYYNDTLKDIHSPFLREVFLQEDLLAFFREVYRKDINQFYLLRDELLLRGIVFKEEYRNNYFPDLPFDISSVLIADKDRQNFLAINREITNLQVLINRFRVSSDLFFNKVPLEGLAYILRKDANLLAKQFENAGFTIKCPAGASEKVTSNIPQRNDETLGEIELFINISLNQDTEEKEWKAHNDEYIEDIFSENDYLAFKRYCKEEGKVFFSDLNIDFVQSFRHVKGVGVRKYENVLNKYKSFSRSVSNFEGHLPNEEKRVSVIEYFLSNPLKNLLEEKNVDYLEFVDSIYYVKKEEELYQPIPEVILEEKSEYIKKVVKELGEVKREKEFDTLKQLVKNHPYYDSLKDLKKAGLQRLLNCPPLDGEENLHLYELTEDILYMDNLSSILNFLDQYIPPHILIEKMRGDLKEREWAVLTGRLNKTLQEVGSLIGVTRERVRQLERKARGKAKKVAKKLKLEIYSSLFLQDRYMITIDEFMENLQIDSSYKEIFQVLLDVNEIFEIKDNKVINKSYYSYAIEKVERIILKNEGIMAASEILEEFNESAEHEFKIEVVDDFMKEVGYTRRNKIYFKGNIKLPSQIRYLFQNEIKDPIEMTDENFSYLQRLMSNYFGTQFESGKRAAVARIRDTKNVILVGANTFMYYDLEGVPRALVEEIQLAIEKELKKISGITADVLYQSNEDKWRSYNIKSHYHLYSILQYHLSENYTIGKGNTLSIFKSQDTKVDTEMVLANYLEKNGGILSKKQILENLKWKSYKLEQVISRSRVLLIVEDESFDGLAVKHISAFDFKEDELEKISYFIEDFMVGDYLFTADLLLEMEFDEYLSEILHRNKITNLYTFASLLKWLNQDLRGYQQFLYKKESEVDTIEKALFEIFPNVVRRDEIEDFLEEKNYSPGTVFKVISQLLENEYFYVYTSYQFINAKQLNFDENVKFSFEQYLKKAFENKWYLSALDLKGYSSDILPVTANGWRPQLIAEFAEEAGYRHIRTTSDYRYNKWILIPKELNIKSYEELVYRIVKEEYQGNYHEKDLAQFLESRKLAHSPSFLSFELKTSNYFEMKDLDFVQVREDLHGIN